MTFDLRPAPAKPSLLARAALGVALFAILTTVYAVVLLRARLVEPAAGFGAFVAGLALAALAAALGVLALVVVWRSGRTGGGRALLAIVLAAATLGGPAYVASKGLRAPTLGDVSTDLADPPRFAHLARERGPADLPVPAAIPSAQAERQRAAYPDIGPLRLSLPPDDVANLAIGLVAERGWRVVGPTAFPRGGPPTGRIEAAARTPVLGLVDDVSIRIREDSDGARVDMRSSARIAGGDFGGEAARIRSFLADLAAAANAAP